MREVDFRSRLLAFRRAGGEPHFVRGSIVLLRLQANPLEAGFLVACLARRVFKWLARTFHSNQLSMKTIKMRFESNNLFERSFLKRDKNTECCYWCISS
jgi:hypothetical protein